MSLAIGLAAACEAQGPRLMHEWTLCRAAGDARVRVAQGKQR